MRGVDFRIRISPRIWNQNRNGLKGSVRDLGQSDLCKNIRKTGSLPYAPLFAHKGFVVCGRTVLSQLKCFARDQNTLECIQIVHSKLCSCSPQYLGLPDKMSYFQLHAMLTQHTGHVIPRSFRRWWISSLVKWPRSRELSSTRVRALTPLTLTLDGPKNDLT